MAQRRGGSVAAPVKQKLRKKHGPKRHMFKDYKPMVKAYADAGLLTKYNDYESFALSCAARGVKQGVREMWYEFRILPREEQDKYLANVKEKAAEAIKKAERKRKAAKKAAEAK